MPQQKALQRASNSSNGQSRLCGVKIMSVPNGELCVKRTGVGGKRGGGWATQRGVYNWCPCSGCTILCVCVKHTHEGEQEENICLCVPVCVRERENEREGTHLSMLRQSKHVGRDKRKKKIKATNTHPLPRWALFSWEEVPGSTSASWHAHRPCIIPTAGAQGAVVALATLLLPGSAYNTTSLILSTVHTSPQVTAGCYLETGGEEGR